MSEKMRNMYAHIVPGLSMLAADEDLTSSLVACGRAFQLNAGSVFLPDCVRKDPVTFMHACTLCSAMQHCEPLLHS